MRWLFDANIYLFVRMIWAVQVEVFFYAVVFLLMIFWGRLRTRPTVLLITFVLASLIGEHATYELQFAPYFALGAFAFLGPERVPYFKQAVSLTVVLISFQLWRFLPTPPDIAALVALILIFLVLVRARIGPRLARIDRRLGDLTYSLYLNQYVVLVAFSSLALGPTVALFWALIAAALLVSIVMYMVVEMPLVHIRARIRQAAVGTST